MNNSTVSIFSLNVSTMNMNETVQYLTEAIHKQQPHQVVTVNPIMVMKALNQPEYMNVLQQAELIVPDGIGIVWAAKQLGNVKIERVAGYDLLHELLKAGEEHRWKIYLLGASPDVVETAAQRLIDTYPRIEVAGYHHGYFTPEDEEHIVSDILRCAPQLLFVANHPDKQEPWIHKYREQLNVPVMMGVGGSFDVIAGKVKRAPVGFQKLGLEWLYRLIQEPARFKRMLALPRFVIKVLKTRNKHSGKNFRSNV